MARNIYGRFDQWVSASGGKSLPAAELAIRFAHYTAACKWVEEYCGRKFSAVVATKAFDGDGSSTLILPDLVSITTITEDDVALVAGAGYRLLPLNRENEPAMRIERLSGGIARAAWSYASFENVEIAGVWGYSYQTEDTLETVPNTATDPAPPAGIDSDDTTIEFASAVDISLGETLVIGTEQVYVAAINDDGDTLTVERGVNGTTAAAHDVGVAIYRRVYPFNLVEAVQMQASRMSRAVQTGGNQAGGVQFGGGFTPEYPMIRDALAPLRRVTVY